MYNSYDELQALCPEAYLYPQNFRTTYDTNPNRAQDRFLEGLAIGQKSDQIIIACNGTWGAIGKDGSVTSSYEGIGYHAYTADLLRGFITSGCPVVIYRYYEHGGNGSNAGTRIAGTIR